MQTKILNRMSAIFETEFNNELQVDQQHFTQSITLRILTSQLARVSLGNNTRQ